MFKRILLAVFMTMMSTSLYASEEETTPPETTLNSDATIEEKIEAIDALLESTEQYVTPPTDENSTTTTDPVNNESDSTSDVEQETIESAEESTTPNFDPELNNPTESTDVNNEASAPSTEDATAEINDTEVNTTDPTNPITEEALDDTTPPSPWENKLEFGYQSSQGNDDEQAFHTNMLSTYTEGQHRYSGEIDYFYSQDEGETEDNQLSISLQSDYKISPDYYLYANFKGISAKYTPYYEDYVVSAGFGYQWYNTETLLIELELGPGYRYQKPNVDEIDDDDRIFPDNVEEAILRSGLNLSWKALERLTLAAEMVATSGQSNTRINYELSATTDITEHIALKVERETEYLDKVPSGLENTDTDLSLSLIFTF